MPAKVVSRCADNKARLHQGRIDDLYRRRSVRLASQDWRAQESVVFQMEVPATEVSEQERRLSLVLNDVRGMVMQGFSDETIKQSILDSWGMVLDGSVIYKIRRHL